MWRPAVEKNNQGWSYQLYQRQPGGQVRWIMQPDHWLWKHGSHWWPWHQKFWVLGPHFDISSLTFTKGHSKSQWYQNRFISWRRVFEGRPALHHSYLGMSTHAGISTRGTSREPPCFEQPNLPFSNSCIPVLHQPPVAWHLHRDGLLCAELTLGSFLFFILIFLVPFPCLPCLFYFNPLLMCAFLLNLCISGV